MSLKTYLIRCIIPCSNAWTGPAFHHAGLLTPRDRSTLLTDRFDKMLVVVARRVHLFAHCIHFKHPVFVRNEQACPLLPFAVLKIKPARFMLWRQNNWHTVVYWLHLSIGFSRHN